MYHRIFSSKQKLSVRSILFKFYECGWMSFEFVRERHYNYRSNNVVRHHCVVGNLLARPIFFPNYYCLRQCYVNIRVT